MVLDNLKKAASNLSKKEQVEFMHFMIDLMAEKTPVEPADDWKVSNNLKKETLVSQIFSRRPFNDINGI